MSKPEKLLEQWTTKAPPEVRLNDVKVLLNRYFPGSWKQESTSHIVAQHDELKHYRGFQPYGEVSLAVKGGRMVKKHYLKHFLAAIRILIEQGLV